MTELRIPDPADRADLGAFTARVVRLDPMAPVRLLAGAGGVTAWAPTPFDALVTRSVRGSVHPADLTVAASALLTALAVDRAAVVDPGRGPGSLPWPGELPPADGWAPVDDVPAAELEGLAERGLALARESAGPHGPPAALLDQTVLTVHGDGPGPAVKVPLRCLFALSGMGFLGAEGGAEGGTVRVAATGTWLRLDARYGGVVRRRLTALPLLVP
jgi:hypothetical protein